MQFIPVACHVALYWTLEIFYTLHMLVYLSFTLYTYVLPLGKIWPTQEIPGLVSKTGRLISKSGKHKKVIS